MSAAYDYAKQRWVTGAEGARLNAEQLRREVEILEGVRGTEFLRMLGMTESLPTAIAARKAEIARYNAQAEADRADKGYVKAWGGM